MSINLDLYQNFDGTLDGRYKQGNKPAPAWQLPTANYVSTGMPMNLVFPRPEAASWSYAKNAYTGVKWNIPIGIQGGAWPFHFEITNDGGAAGITIGEDLTGAVDGATGKTVYTVGADYGVLSWDSPVAGSYTITVRVTDQTSAILDVTVSLTVGTSGWLFVDPVSGNDSTGDGSIGNPFASLVPLHSDSSATTTYANQRVYLRAGTTPLGGMTANSGNYRLEANAVPCQYIGYPDEAAILEWDTGWFVISDVDDYLCKDLECKYKSTYLPSGAPIYMYSNVSGGDRLTLINNAYTNFDGSPVNTGSGNTSIIYLSGTDKSNFFVSRCSQTGKTGTFTSAYQVTGGLIEHHRVHNATTGIDDGSAHGIIWLKDDPVNFTVRNVEMWENITWAETNNYGGIGMYGQDGAQNVEICYCTVDCPIDPSVSRGGAIYNWGNNPVSALIQDIFMYRNSLDIGIEWEGSSHTNMANGTEVHSKNVLNGGSEISNAKVSNVDNLDASTYLDATMKLTGGSRTSYLGTHGAEVAK